MSQRITIRPTVTDLKNVDAVARKLQAAGAVYPTPTDAVQLALALAASTPIPNELLAKHL